MLHFLKSKLQAIYVSLTEQLHSLFSKSIINDDEIKELERLLLQADTGSATTKIIIEKIKKKCAREVVSGIQLKQFLHEELNTLLVPFIDSNPAIILLVGINGSGKTTCAAKLAYHHQQQGKRVLLVAADTFRAAAVDQLRLWAEQLNIEIVFNNEQKDPGALIYEACDRFKKEQFDSMIIDTAGRLQTKINLMHELAKLKRIVAKQVPSCTMQTLLTIDAMLGQNSLQQAQIFHESTTIDGIILTKMDGTGKGGIVFSIYHNLKIPVVFMTTGEQKEQLYRFDANHYIKNLLE